MPPRTTKPRAATARAGDTVAPRARAVAKPAKTAAKPKPKPKAAPVVAAKALAAKKRKPVVDSESICIDGRYTPVGILKLYGVTPLSQFSFMTETGHEAPVYVVDQAAMAKLAKAGFKPNGSWDADEIKVIKLVGHITPVLATPTGCGATGAVCDSWEGFAGDHKRWQELFNEFSTKLGGPVRFSCPHGTSQPAETVGPMRVRIWSGPTRECGDVALGGREIRVPLWGFAVGCTDYNASIKTWVGRAEVKAPEGLVVAQYDRHNLYIFFDACHTGNANEFKIMKEILNVVAENYHKLPKEEVVAKPVDAADLYVKFCSKRGKTTVDELKADLKRRQDKVTQMQRQMVDEIRGAKDVEQRLVAAMGGISGDSSRFRSEYESLARSPRVTDIGFEDTKLYVHTTDLCCTDPRTRKKHYIGRFKLTVDAATGDYRIQNLVFKVHGMNRDQNAPHVWADGHACLGTISSTLPQLIASFELSAAIQLMIAFLENVNIDDGAGLHINKWPLWVEPEKAVEAVPGVEAPAVPKDEIRVSGPEVRAEAPTEIPVGVQ